MCFKVIFKITITHLSLGEEPNIWRTSTTKRQHIAFLGVQACNVTKSRPDWPGGGTTMFKIMKSLIWIFF